MPELEADVYNNDRLRWLSSRLDRSSYVDEYVDEFGQPENFNLMDLIGNGQVKEKEEVYYSVLSSLEQITESMGDEEETEEE